MGKDLIGLNALVACIIIVAFIVGMLFSAN